jgi:hypothetical protein
MNTAQVVWKNKEGNAYVLLLLEMLCK